MLCTVARRVDELKAASTQDVDVESVPIALEYMAKVVVQDACVLANRFPDHPVYKRLREHPEFGCATLCGLRHL